MDLDWKEVLPRRPIRQERVHVPPRVDLPSGFGFVQHSKALGRIRREEYGEVEATMADIYRWRANARFAPVNHTGQQLARPQHVEMLVVTMQEAACVGAGSLATTAMACLQTSGRDESAGGES